MTRARDKLSAADRQQEQVETRTAAVAHAPVSPELAELIGRRPANDQITTAVVESISPDGVAKVVLAGDTHACDASSLVQCASAASASEALLGRTVLVLLNRHTQPVILGVVTQRLWEKPQADTAREAYGKLSKTGSTSLELDKRTIDLEAADEIRLTCGKSSLVLRSDGTVIMRGVRIVSRASESNKIKGSTVNIN
jgi:hypothetical protein